MFLSLIIFNLLYLCKYYYVNFIRVAFPPYLLDPSTGIEFDYHRQ